MAKATELASVPTLSSQPTKKVAPAKKAKKEQELYIFKLLKEHPKYSENASIFPAVFTIPNVDTIIWNYGTEDNPDYQPREIRYIDGLRTIFKDEQEVNGPLAESVLNKQTNVITFNEGFLRVPSWNKPLIQFLTINNQCDKNENKFKQINSTYTLMTYSVTDDDRVELGKKKDRAYDLARTCSEDDMIPHARFLGIPFIHTSTGEERDMDAIREDYKAKALENPEKFLLMANNPKVKLRFLIDKGLNQGVITTGLVKGQAHWVATKQLITSIPINMKDIDALTDFAASEDGAAFVQTLKMQL